MKWGSALQAWAQALRHQLYALWLALQRKDLPWAARWIALLVVAYALSPIDLIPDFIPLLGYLDDLILLPLGLAWAIKLIPPEIWQDCQARATSQLAKPHLPRNWFAGMLVITLWLLCLYGGWMLLAGKLFPTHA